MHIKYLNHLDIAASSSFKVQMPDNTQIQIKNMIHWIFTTIHSRVTKIEIIQQTALTSSSKEEIIFDLSDRYALPIGDGKKALKCFYKTER